MVVVDIPHICPQMTYCRADDYHMGREFVFSFEYEKFVVLWHSCNGTPMLQCAVDHLTKKYPHLDILIDSPFNNNTLWNGFQIPYGEMVECYRGEFGRRAIDVAATVRASGIPLTPCAVCGVTRQQWWVEGLAGTWVCSEECKNKQQLQCPICKRKHRNVKVKVRIRDLDGENAPFSRHAFWINATGLDDACCSGACSTKLINKLNRETYIRGKINKRRHNMYDDLAILKLVKGR